jgi:hypothetical protein
MRPSTFLLILFLLAALWLQVCWIDAGTVPPQLDSTGFIWNSVDLYRYFCEPGESFLLKLSHSFDHPYPHWEYYVTMVFYHFMGVSVRTNAFSLLPWFLIFLLSMYGCGKALCGEKGGWLLLLGAAGSPAFTLLSKFYFQEVPITAVTALGLYLLVSSGYFEKGWLSILFGLCLGAVMMFKGTGVLFLAAPLPAVFLLHVVGKARPRLWKIALLVIAALAPFLARGIVSSRAFLGLAGMQESQYLPFCLFFDAIMVAGAAAALTAPGILRNRTLSRAWNMLGALFAAFAVFFPWYAVNCAAVGGKIDEHRTFMPRDSLPFFYNLMDLENMLYLAKIMMLLGLAVYLTRRENMWKYAPFLSGAAIAFVGLSLTHPHFMKYSLPLLPFVLITGLLWLIEPDLCSRPKPLRRAVIPVCIILLLQLLGGWLPFAGSVFLRAVPLHGGDPPEPWGRCGLWGLAVPTAPPVREPFHIGECLERIRALSPPGKIPSVLAFVEFTGPFFLDRQNFTLEAKLRGMSVVFLDGLDPEARFDGKGIDFCLEVRPKTSILSRKAELPESGMGKTLGGSSPRPAKPDEPPHLLVSHAFACLARGLEITDGHFPARPLETGRRGRAAPTIIEKMSLEQVEYYALPWGNEMRLWKAAGSSPPR